MEDSSSLLPEISVMHSNSNEEDVDYAHILILRKYVSPPYVVDSLSFQHVGRKLTLFQELVAKVRWPPVDDGLEELN